MHCKEKSILLLISIIAIAALCSGTVFGQGTTALLLQQSPSDGGMVTPGAGVHDVARNSPVTVSAMAKPGYQFVYWIGDVGDPTSSTTTVSTESPKIVIAVFEKENQDLIEAAGVLNGAGGTMLTPSAADYSRTGGSGGGGRRSNPTPPIMIPTNDTFPIPDNPVPEPASVLLLGIGALISKRILGKRS